MREKEELFKVSRSGLMVEARKRRGKIAIAAPRRLALTMPEAQVPAGVPRESPSKKQRTDAN